jgi:hypothetical protein
MDDTMVFNEVANDNKLGSLVLLNSWIIDLKIVVLPSICVFMFGGYGGLGFSASSCVFVGF